MKRLLSFLSCVAVLSGCTGGGSSDGTDPIKVGYLGPLTGEATSYGMDTLNGVKIAVEDINAEGGINGRKIELIAEDGRCTGTDAAGAAQKLIHVDKVSVIIGGQCSGETLAAAPIAEAAKVVMMSPLSSSPDVTNAGDFIFRDYPNDALKTKAMANYFKEKGYTRVVLITENTDFAMAFRNSLKENTGADNFVLDEVVEPGTKDYRSLLTRLKGKEFDVFFPNGQTSATVAAMIEQFREQGFLQPMVSHDVAQDKSLLDLAPKASKGMHAINVPEVSVDSAFGSKFLSKFGDAQASLAFAAHAHDAMRVLAAAMKEVGTDSMKIRDYLYALKGHDGVVGRFRFDKNGDVVGIPYVLYEVKDGAWGKVADIPVD
ncbi:ABC transporter substrate-binding protein [Candidatus Peregrinibacteria bacterium]|nr:ABC transporter substrate-binding protein [Candidatus Peregrinibacteria bacterium]